MKRLLDKTIKPSFQDMLQICGDVSEYFQKINDYICEKDDMISEIKFPYGNNYGWCISYHKKNKLFCNLFPGEKAFNIMIRLTNKEFSLIYEDGTKYLQELIDNKYVCGEAGWIHYEFTDKNQYNDLLLLLNTKRI